VPEVFLQALVRRVAHPQEAVAVHDGPSALSAARVVNGRSAGTHTRAIPAQGESVWSASPSPVHGAARGSLHQSAYLTEQP
jgi:hypothetical protein